MPATISVTVDDPPDPPAGFVADGFHLHHGPLVGSPQGADRRTLTEAVAAWVGLGTERTDLFALATSQTADGDITLGCTWVEDTQQWGEWEKF